MLPLGISADNAFWGESDHSIDDKGRLLIPIQHRDILGNECVLTRGPDRVILIFKTDAWAHIEETLYGDVLASKSRILQRLFSSRFAVNVDPRGRIAVPKVLRDWAQIEPGGRVVMLGQGQTIEIWSSMVWDAYQQSFTSANTLEVAAEMGLGDLFRL